MLTMDELLGGGASETGATPGILSNSERRTNTWVDRFASGVDAVLDIGQSVASFDERMDWERRRFEASAAGMTGPGAYENAGTTARNATAEDGSAFNVGSGTVLALGAVGLVLAAVLLSR